MQIDFEQIIDKHKGTAAVVTVHGPSLNENKEKIKDLQKQKKIIRIDCSDWLNFFEEPPDYWIIANGELAIQDLINDTGIWKLRNYSIDVNKYEDATIFFAGSVDFSDRDFVSENLKPDYLIYDQRHFKHHKCLDILKNFQRHYKEKQEFNFTEYGNNSSMWMPPRYKGGAGFSGALPHGPTGGGKCCNWINPNVATVQEKLQEVSGYSEHYSTGDTVAVHMIAFAIIMGCNPVYISGLDLDYKLGFANKNVYLPQDNDDWQKLSNNLKNDLKVLNESAKIRGIQIVNLHKDPWYNEFEKGALKIHLGEDNE